MHLFRDLARRQIYVPRRWGNSSPSRSPPLASASHATLRCCCCLWRGHRRHVSPRRDEWATVSASSPLARCQMTAFSAEEQALESRRDYLVVEWASRTRNPAQLYRVGEGFARRDKKNVSHHRPSHAYRNPSLISSPLCNEQYWKQISPGLAMVDGSPSVEAAACSTARHVRTYTGEGKVAQARVPLRSRLSSFDCAADLGHCDRMFYKATI